MDTQMRLKDTLHQDLPDRLDQPVGSVSKVVQDEIQRYEHLWWSCKQSLPEFNSSFRSEDQTKYEKQLGKLATGLVYQMKDLPKDPTERKTWQNGLRAGFTDFILSMGLIEQRHLDFVETSGLLGAAQEFGRMARRFDPAIRSEDIYQAGRNVMTANLIQILFELPVRVTPSIFAYSMLYPYTDNFLDDAGISYAQKLAFNTRFKHRLEGQEVLPENSREEVIHHLIGMIETEWERNRHPKVYESLLAIHAAQAHSLDLVAPGASPFERDVLGISFEKGGTSVLADGYLVSGNLTGEQTSLLFGFGAFTQLMDDLEDLQADLQEDRMSIFTQTAVYWPLDGVTNSLFHFSRLIMENLGAFHSPSAMILTEIMRRCLDPILIGTVGRMGRYYHRDYLIALEKHTVIRTSAMEKQRKKLSRQKINIGKLVEAML